MTMSNFKLYINNVQVFPNVGVF